MLIKFPQEEELFSFAISNMTYEQLVERHLYFLREQSNCEFFYWKGLGVFFLLVLSFFMFQGKLSFSPSVGIALAGASILLVFRQKMTLDFEYGRRASICARKGLHMEEKLNYSERLFGIFEDNKKLSYHGYLIGRIFPTSLIGLITGWAAVFLALKVGIELAIMVSIFSLFSLYLLVKLYVKTGKKILLGDK